MGETQPGLKSFLGGTVSGNPKVRHSERRAIIGHDEGAEFIFVTDSVIRKQGTL